jgi:hypothetical protein
MTVTKLNAVSPRLRGEADRSPFVSNKKVTITVLPKNVIHENPKEIDLDAENMMRKHKEYKRKQAEFNKIRDDANRMELPAEKD